MSNERITTDTTPLAILSRNRDLALEEAERMYANGHNSLSQFAYGQVQAYSEAIRIVAAGTQVHQCVSHDEVIWVISKGSYSDYRVLCACPSKGAAASIAKRYNELEGTTYEEAVVESLPMISADVQRVEVLALSVEILDDGTERANRESTRIEWPFDSIYPMQPVHWHWVRAPYIKHIGGRLDVTGTDHERVRKVFGDRRALIRSDDAVRARTEVEGTR